MKLQELKDLLEEVGFVKDSPTLKVHNNHIDEGLWYTINGASNYAIKFNENRMISWPEPVVMQERPGEYEMKFVGWKEQKLESLKYDKFKKELEITRDKVFSRLAILRKKQKEQRIQAIREL